VGAEKAASNAIGQLHADTREFMLHLDLDVIAQEEFPATNVPGGGGLSFAETQTALTEFARHKNLLGLDIAQYNPEKDPDGSAAKKVIDLLAEVLSARLAALTTPPAPAATEETPSTTA
jgi:arginase